MFRLKDTRITSFAALFILLLASLACNAILPDRQPATLTPTLPATVEPVMTEKPAVTEAPAVTETPPVTEEPAPDVSFLGVTFSYDESVLSSVNGEVIAEDASTDTPTWSTPEHIRFGLQGYRLVGTFHDPRILIFPVDEFTTVNPAAQEIIAELQALLEAQPADESIDRIAFLPVFNAAKYMQAQVAYLEFQSGRGVRFLTQYGQAALPINNEDLFYTFQGISDDGRFYISAILPVSHPSLPDPNSVVLDDAFFENFEDYISEMELQMSGEHPESFTPSLLLLDEMIKSIDTSGLDMP